MKVVSVAAMLMTAASGAHAQDAAPGDPAAGQKVFGTCKACHAVGEGAANRVGPQLNDVFGRVPGSVQDYRYSNALVEYGKAHIWDSGTLAQYLTAPRQVVPGTKMAFAGIRNEKQIADVLAYLAQFDPQGAEVQEGVQGTPAQ